MARDHITLAPRGVWWQTAPVKYVLLALALAAACSCNAAGGAVDGKQIFLSAGCTRCHGPTGKPTDMMTARLHVQDLTAPAFRAKVTPALVAHQVRHGSDNHLMPSFEGALTDAQIDALAKFVASPAFLTLSRR